jgi:hypothetical protein
MLRRTIFGKNSVSVVELEPNTFIGLGGAHFPNEQSLATFLNVSLNDIKLFSIDNNNCLSFRIEKDFYPPVYFEYKEITYFLDKGGFCKRGSINGNKKIRIALYMNLPVVNNAGLSYDNVLKTVIIPNTTSIGTSVENDSVFTNSFALRSIFAHASQETIRSGVSDADLAQAVSYGAAVTYGKTDTEILLKPEKPTNISLLNNDGFSASFDFSQVNNTLFAITSYEVYVNGVLNNVSNLTYTGGKIRATNLQPNTTYNLTVKAVNEILEKSDFTTALQFTTGNNTSTYVYPSSLQSLFTFKGNMNLTTMNDENSNNNITFTGLGRYSNFASLKHNSLIMFSNNMKINCVNVKAIIFVIYIPSDSSQPHYLVDFRSALSAYMYNATSGGISKTYVNGALVANNISQIPRNQWNHVYIETTGVSNGVITLLSRYTNAEFLDSAISHFSTWNAALSVTEINNHKNEVL